MSANITPDQVDRPMVSVMMLTYNHAPYIREAVDSVLAQRTRFPVELVIGEDCSTDGTREIVLDYQARFPDRIRVVKSDSNVGAKENSYRTLMACRGKYLAQCEGDDYWHAPDKLQKQVMFLERHADYGLVHSSYDILAAASGTRIADFPKARRHVVPDTPDITHIIRECRASFRIQTCTTMVRRDLYVALVEKDPSLYRSAHFRMGDTQLWAEISTLAKVGYIPESLATYRLLPESASRSRDLTKGLRFELSHAEMLIYLCDKHHLTDALRQHCVDSWCNTALRLAFHEGDAGLAAQAKARLTHVSIKEKLFFLGATNAKLRRLLTMAANVRGLIFREPISA